jgi:hypothetical protein
MLTPSLGGSTAAAFGQGLGNLQDVRQKQQEIMAKQAAAQYEASQDAKKLAISQQGADQTGQYQKDRIAALKSGAGHSGVTERLIQQYQAANPNATWNDAYNAVKSSSNETARDAIRVKQLAQKAMKDGTALPGIETPTIDDYVAYFGGKGKAASKGIPDGAKMVGTSGGKKVYALPDGSHVMEQ